ncbi:MAG: mannitol dehydrogenase family protein [Oscillospiraceae bacterium]|nr:mannitol dehydrogenase family protein [Oscillospiraceae bacterium]
MNLKRTEIENTLAWKKMGISLPRFCVSEMCVRTKEAPQWVHFGAGNIFRAFIARISQNLLNLGLVESGIVAVETYDYEIIDRVYKPYSDLSLFVGLKSDGNMDMEVIASVARSLNADSSVEKDWSALHDIFKNPELQLVSVTITEKGYGLYGADGKLLAVVSDDIKSGPSAPRHAMSVVAALLYSRFLSGGAPLALVSMDNCSRNGEVFYKAVYTVAEGWYRNGHVDRAFLDYISDETKVAFPWSMIDKITPYPDDSVYKELTRLGLEGMEPLTTSKNSFTAPFVNAEIPEYLVIEDSFPNGRPPLEKAGVYLTDRETVNKTEKMKVTTCLNPLHTALAVFGCLLGFKKISDMMNDQDMVNLVNRLGYTEGMPVVTDPKIIRPRAFIKEVLEKRLPNPFLPDTPQRIATDTSQKMAIRFGETIRAYMESEALDTAELTVIPLVIAGWLRYLLAVDDNGNEMPLSPDPALGELTALLSDICVGVPNIAGGQLYPILSNAQIFGVNLFDAGLGEKVIKIFNELIAKPGAVREVVRKYT